MDDVKNNTLEQQQPDSDERLGNALSAGLKVTVQQDRCLTDEEISLLVDGPNRATHITEEKRDHCLMHLSACRSCMEVFQLASELREEEAQVVALSTTPAAAEEPGLIRTRSRYSRPLAIAASILVAAVAMIIFYRSNEIPKTAEELINRPLAMDETTLSSKTSNPTDLEESKRKDKKNRSFDTLPPAQPPAAAQTTEIEDTITTPEKGKRLKKDIKLRQEKGPLPEKNASPKKEEINSILENLEERATQLTLAKSSDAQKESETRLQEKTAAEFKEIEKTTGKKADEKGGHIHAIKGPQTVALQKDEDKTGFTKLRAEKQPERLLKKEGAPQKGRKGPRVNEQSARKVAFGTSVGLTQVEQLKRKFREYKTYIPANRLNELFRETVGLASVLNRSAHKLGASAAQSGDYSKVNAFRMSVVPVYAIHMGNGTLRVSPNVDYFRSKSDPDSPEYRFYTLARTGWSDGAGHWYGPDIHGAKSEERVLGNIQRRSRQPVKKTALTASSHRSKTGALISRWTELYPRLSAPLQEIARHTIEQLKKEYK
jgi:hypothetical protein